MGSKIKDYFKKNNYKGKFIVFEGLDGSGQSTMSLLLANFLREKGKKVFLTKEPTKENKEIRDILEKRKKFSPCKLQLLFAKDRKEHLEKEIIPALKNGEIVISDRYMFSSFAYGLASGCSLRRIFYHNKNFLLPDILFFLDAKADVCLQRIKNRGTKTTLFERRLYLKRVYMFYKEILKGFDNIFYINAEKQKPQVFAQIKKVLEKTILKTNNF